MLYKALYKCRLCGGRFYETAFTTDSRDKVASGMVHLNLGIRGAVPQQPTMTSTHQCGGGDFGLADFQGWEYVPGRLDDKTESGLLEE